MDTRTAWTRDLPARPGYFEVWDPHRRINRIVNVFETPNGALAVRNFCNCKYAFLVRMWELPCFVDTHWRGPLHVPEGVGPTGECVLPHCDEAAA